MASGPSTGYQSALTFYPAYCHRASPTWFTWVKLAASDIHNTLRCRKGFDIIRQPQQHQQQILFYLNHPVQFVSVVGTIVAFDQYFEQFWLFTLDDSSGATIDVTCRKPQPQTQNGQAQGGAKRGREKDDDITEGDPRVQMMAQIDVGSVVQVKGTVGSFRDVRQIQLERIAIIHDTNAEMRFCQQRMQLWADILRQPWIVSQAQQQELRKQAEHGAGRSQDSLAKRRQRDARRRAREERDAEEILEHYEVEERERQHAAEEARAEAASYSPAAPIKSSDCQKK